MQLEYIKRKGEQRKTPPADSCLSLRGCSWISMKRGGSKFGDGKTTGCPLSKKGGCSFAVGTQTQRVNAPPPPPPTPLPRCFPLDPPLLGFGASLRYLSVKVLPLLNLGELLSGLRDHRELLPSHLVFLPLTRWGCLSQGGHMTLAIKLSPFC